MSPLDSLPGLLSFRRAARVLGISRETTLPDLVRDGRLKTVRVGSRLKIPVTEIKRLLVDSVAWKLKP
jgi:excisionase family DNA binding protein